eukprot:SAG31_NODE_7534_length_1662_cov_1.420985_3_plen_272_part_01
MLGLLMFGRLTGKQFDLHLTSLCERSDTHFAGAVRRKASVDRAESRRRQEQLLAHVDSALQADQNGTEPSAGQNNIAEPPVARELDAHEAVGEPSSASVEYQQSLSEAAETAETYLARGRTMASNGDHRAAIEQYEAGLMKWPENEFLRSAITYSQAVASQAVEELNDSSTEAEMERTWNLEVNGALEAHTEISCQTDQVAQLPDNPPEDILQLHVAEPLVARSSASGVVEDVALVQSAAEQSPSTIEPGHDLTDVSQKLQYEVACANDILA